MAWNDERSFPAPKQETVLVCDCHFKGRYFIATKDALGDWREGWVAGDLISPPPTHWQWLEPAPERSIN